jgi:hypothetical protein
MARSTQRQSNVARKAGAKALQAIAMQYVPRGYTVEYCKALTGRYFSALMLIQAPRPVTPKSLYIFLHECAHANLGHSSKSSTPRHVQEYEAEMWAHAKMVKHGIPVPPEYTERARRYVAFKIMQAERRGAKRIDPQARAFAGEAYISEHHARWEAALGKSKMRV